MRGSLIALLIFNFIACSAVGGVNNTPPMSAIKDTIPNGLPQQKWAGWIQTNKQLMADSGFAMKFIDTSARPKYPMFGMLTYDSSFWQYDMISWKKIAKNNDLYTLPNGLNGQLPFYNQDDSNSTTAADVLNIGKFVYNDAQLDSMKTTHAAQIDIFNRWDRFSHGGLSGAGNGTTANVSDTIPNRADATNSWGYNSVSNLVFSTLNTGSTIGFINNIFSKNYTLQATISAGLGSVPDNDRIGFVIAFVEDHNDMVRNNAYGLNPNDFDWAINTTDSLIPNQHSLIVYRQRASSQYYVVYDNGLPDHKVIIDGNNIPSYHPTGVWDSTSTELKLRVVRNGDTVHVFTTNPADAPGGQGALANEITFLLTSDPLLDKFRSGSFFGLTAQSQERAYWNDFYFSDNSLNIYDLRNGDVWTYDGEMYTLSDSLNVFRDIGIRRLWYNPYIGTFGDIRQDSSYDVIHTPESGGIDNITGLVEAGSNITLDGTGTIADPYVINATGSGSVGNADSLGGVPANGYVQTSRTITTTAPLTGGGNLSANRTLAITQSTTSTNGYLSSTDWNTFNGKIGVSSPSTGDMLYYNSGWQKLAIGTTKQTLHVVGGVPVWRDTSTSGGGGSPAGNYGNLQINRNGVFTTPASDSLSFNSGYLLTIGGMISHGFTTYNSAETKSINLNSNNPTIDMNGVGTTLHLNATNITGVKSIEFPNASGTLAIVTAYSTLTYSSTPTIDYDAGQNRVITLTGNATVSYANFPSAGEVYMTVIQDGTGGRTMTFPSGTVFPTGVATGLVINLSTAAGAVDVVHIKYNNITSKYYVELAKAYQ